MNGVTRWVRFATPTGRVGIGTLEGELVREHVGDPYLGALPTESLVRRDEVELLAPCTPSKIVALWNNFHALAAKLVKRVPTHPLFLIKPSTALAGPGATIERPAGYAGRLAFEGELGIVIKRRCTNVSIAAAADHILGYTCVNDVTAIDLLDEDPNFAQWCRAKGSDTFACVGPAIAAGLDWRSARVVTRVDGVERQNYALSDMVFSPEEQVSRLSRDLTLLPGDVIACGTSLGVGTLKDGARVEIAIDGIGILANVVASRESAVAVRDTEATA